MDNLEQWRPIPGYPGYEISRWGEVRGYRGRGRIGIQKVPHMMKVYSDRNGVPTVKMYSKKVQKPVAVMTLMVMTWLQKPQGLIAYHKNGVKSDNRLENIGFCKREELPSIRLGHNRHPIAKIDAEGNVIELYPSQKVAANKNYMDIKTLYAKLYGLEEHNDNPDGSMFIFADELKGE